MEEQIVDFTQDDSERLQKIYEMESKNQGCSSSYLMFGGIFVIILSFIFMFMSSDSTQSIDIPYKVFIFIFLTLPGCLLIYMSQNFFKGS